MNSVKADVSYWRNRSYFLIDVRIDDALVDFNKTFSIVQKSSFALFLYRPSV